MSVGVKGAAVPVCRKQGGLRPCDAVRKRRCRFRDREWARYRQEKAAPAGSVRPELGNRLWTSLGVWELVTEPTDDVRAALLVRSNSKRIC